MDKDIAFCNALPLSASFTPSKLAAAKCTGGAQMSMHDASHHAHERSHAVSRRALLFTAASGAVTLASTCMSSHSVLAATTTPPSNSVLNAESTLIASDLHGYSFRVPAEAWNVSTTTISGARRLTAAFPKDTSAAGTSVTMVETGVPSDFRKLTSFGPVDKVLDTLVPRGRPDIQGSVIKVQNDLKRNAYVVEYTLKAGERAPNRHLLTVFSLQPGRYLLTLTAQALEERWPADESTLRSILDTYQLNILD